jgi:pyruvate,water dikinase
MYVLPLDQLRMTDVARVGGKNASLGELISQLAASSVRVPGGFATTARAFDDFLAHNKLVERIRETLAKVDVEDVSALAAAGAEIRGWVEKAALQPEFEREVRAAYGKLAGDEGGGVATPSFAVRSSATAEDLPDASFAGQQETYLNIRGADNVLEAIRRVFASLYNDRAIAYRVHKGFAHAGVSISAGVQRMVRSDLGAAGVMFSMDTESGFREVVFITSSYGLGEMVVQGAVNPDEFYVSKLCLANGKPAVLRRGLGGKAIKMIFDAAAQAGRSVKEVEVSAAERDRFSLADAEVEELARYAVAIEKHYQRPMDIEWGRDGEDGKLYILQARPETVKSQETRKDTLTRYRIGKRGDVLASGRAIGSKIGQGRVRVIEDVSEIAKVQDGDVLVTDMTDPNWEPVMKRASAIVTNRGGRTCHAAIIARELGVPAVVGCEDATEKVPDGAEVTVSCAEGDTGFIYAGKTDFELQEIKLDKMPSIPVKIAMNVGNPQLAFDFCQLPNEGVGLARLEFIISNTIGIHPKACLEFDSLGGELKAQVARQARGYDNPVRFYVEKIVEGVATIAAAFWPKKVIVRMSDFKSNEYRNLIGGTKYEPTEENPMLGFRGASRYIASSFRDCFDLECEAMRKVRDTMGLTNVELMIPFVRTVKEGEQVLAILRQNGLERGRNGLRVVMMCEIPSNAILADDFLKHFDGFSIGSNDMTQLTLALDRDSGLVMDAFDERDAAVKRMLHLAIQACLRHGKYVGICGQGPSDYPDLAEWLMAEGIESMSLNPDTVVETWLHLAKSAASKETVGR